MEEVGSFFQTLRIRTYTLHALCAVLSEACVPRYIADVDLSFARVLGPLVRDGCSCGSEHIYDQYFVV